jgi:hypothetical protein
MPEPVLSPQAQQYLKRLGFAGPVTIVPIRDGLLLARKADHAQEAS